MTPFLFKDILTNASINYYYSAGWHLDLEGHVVHLSESFTSIYMRGNHSLRKTPQAFLSWKRATNMQKKKKNVAPVKKVFYPKMNLVWGGGIKLLPEWWTPIALSSRAWSWPANKCDGNYAFIFSGRHFHQSQREQQWKVITLSAWLRCSHSQASPLQQVHWDTCFEPFFCSLLTEHFSN